METYSVELTQRNKEDVVTFQAYASSIKAKNEIVLSLKIATFCKETMAFTDKMKKHKVKFGNAQRIKITHDMELKITQHNDGANVIFTIPSFGKLVKNSSIKSLQNIIYQQHIGRLKVKSHSNKDNLKQSLPQEFFIKNPFATE